MLDIVKIKQAVKAGELKVYVKNGKIYLQDDIGECVEIGTASPTGSEVLDKIRTEIDQLETYYDNDYFSENRDSMFKCNEVLQIINKYKASPTRAEGSDKE